jgi:hypothetical protein
MFTLFMKKHATDTSAEETSRIKSILVQNNLKFEVMIARGRTGSDRGSHTYLKSSPVVYGIAPEPVFNYSVYVKRKDYARARKLVLGA